MIYVLTLKRYAGVLAVRFTFTEDQEDLICSVDWEMFRGRETSDEINNCKTFHRDRRP
jgi:hypothetical protein